MFKDEEDGEEDAVSSSPKDIARQKMRVYLVMLVNHLFMATGQRRKADHDPYGWTSGALALLDSSLGSVLKFESSEGDELGRNMRLLVAMCFITSVKFNSDYADTGVLNVLYAALLPGDSIPDRRALNVFTERYEIYLMQMNNVFACLQENEFTHAVRDLEKMRAQSEITHSTFKICNKVIFFFYYQLGTTAKRSPVHSNGLSVLALACLQCAEAVTVLPRRRVNKKALEVAKLLASQSRDVYTCTQITLGGAYMEATSRETSITCKSNVVRGVELLETLV